jgi:excinuclease ABC subunit B
MSRRREKQLAYNEAHGITPRSVKKTIDDALNSVYERDYVTVDMAAEDPEDYVATLDIEKTMKTLRKRMKESADRMDFEKAAEYRDRLMSLEKRQIEIGA